MLHVERSPRKPHGDESLGLYVSCGPGWRRKLRFVHYLFAAIYDRCAFLAACCILVSANVHTACRRRARGEGSLHIRRLRLKDDLQAPLTGRLSLDTGSIDGDYMLCLFHHIDIAIVDHIDACGK